MAADHRRLVADALLKAEQKLEAIKTHRENFRHSNYIEWLRELDKILEDAV